MVDGQWTEWVDDTACSVTCGSGVLMQTRSCTNPSPANGGANCIGDEEQTGTTPCTLADCPGKPRMQLESKQIPRTVCVTQ